MRTISTKGCLLLVAIVAAASGCAFRAEELVKGPAPAELGTPFQISATPAFRLIVDQDEGDLPSRLLVVWARIETDRTQTFDVRPIDARVVLPDGGKVRVLDRDRAAVLVRRTWLGTWDLSYKGERGHAWGGIAEPVRRRLQEEVISALIDDSALTPHHPLEGYLVVDTVMPMSSLDRVGLEIVARRVPDRTRVRNTYQFASSTLSLP